MKILLVNDDLQGGGKQRRLVQLIRGLESNPELELHLVVFDHRGSAHRTGRGSVQDVRELVDFPEIWNYRVQIHFLERQSRKDLSIFPRLYALLRQLRPDVVNVWSVMGCFYILPFVWLMRLRLISSFVADCNGPRPFSFPWVIVRMAFALSRVVTGNSTAGLQAYAAPMRKSKTIYNGFDFARFNSVEPREIVREELGIRTRYAVSMVARFDPTKDYDTFIEGFLQASARHDDLTAVCIGQGPDLEAIKSKVPPGMVDRVLFPGYRKDVESILAACDFSVLCTNAALHGEGISNSILEGMAAGHPVIATNGGGSPEIVIHGQTGFLVASDAPDQVARSICTLMGDPDTMQSMGEAARQNIQAKFSLDRMTNEFLSAFRSAMPEEV